MSNKADPHMDYIISSYTSPKSYSQDKFSILQNRVTAMGVVNGKTCEQNP